MLCARHPMRIASVKISTRTITFFRELKATGTGYSPVLVNGCFACPCALRALVANE